MKKAYLLLLGMGLLLFGLPMPQSAAQSCNMISSGQAVYGYIDATNWYAAYCYNGVAGETVSIAAYATSGNLDTFLSLADPNGQAIVENDDAAPGNLNSEITYTLPTTQSYVIYVQRLGGQSGGTTGNFELYLDSLSSPGSADFDGDGYPDATDSCPNTFGGPPDGCPRPDSDSDGFNDNMDSCPLTPGIAPDGCPSGSNSGSYCSNELFYNQSISGYLDNSVYFQEYCFGGAAGDIVQIYMTKTNGNLDTYLTLYDDFGTSLMTNDDTNNGTDSFIEYTLPTSGYYFIVASRFSQMTGTSSGDYQLDLYYGGTTTNNSITAPPNRNSYTQTTLDHTAAPNYGSVWLSAGFTPDPYRVSILSGGNVDASYISGCTGYVTGSPDFYLSWSGNSQRVTLFFTPEDTNGATDSTLIIRAPNGDMYCVDDSYGTLSPTVDITQPVNGDYAIWVGSFNQSENVRGTLYITELSYNPSNLPDAPTVGVSCPQTLPSRLVIGDIARVAFGGIANRVRNGPGLDYDQIGRLVPGASFDVIGGPLCAHGYTWYQVSYGRTVGWSAEASPNEYWLEPLGN